jgi:hypothetical protein
MLSKRLALFIEVMRPHDTHQQKDACCIVCMHTCRCCQANESTSSDVTSSRHTGAHAFTDTRANAGVVPSAQY